MTNANPWGPAREGFGAATRLERLFREAGFYCQIEAGAIGIIVYGPSAAVVATVADTLVTNARVRDPRARREGATPATGEPARTSWACTVRLDWRCFGAELEEAG